MTTPVTERDLPEELMSAMSRYEKEAYRAGTHDCCKERDPRIDMANPSIFGACDEHGPRCRASLSLLLHALAQYVERIVEECARIAEEDPGAAAGAIRALAPRCPTCRGTALHRLGPNQFTYEGPPCPDCSRGKAYRHWATLTAPQPSEKP